MSMLSAYRRPLESMQYFHRHHQAELQQMLAACRTATTLHRIQRLAYSLRSFSSGLHSHHTIEDKAIFPFLASRTDIRHLAAHHLLLDTALATLDSLADKLLRLKEADGYDSSEAEAVVAKVQALVIEHENAEEAVLAADNLAKCMSEDECRRWYRH